ncbi:MAG: type III pantothenate kinase [Planctomycetia bacterium]|jgi:type III pantothenate kinase
MDTLIAVDIGNSQIKLGRRRPTLSESISFHPDELIDSGAKCLGEWIAEQQQDAAIWRIGSVNRPTTTRLLNWLHENRPEDKIHLLMADEVPIKVAVPRPDMVGIDRLLGAAAAYRRRSSHNAVIVVDIGSAITIDLVSSKGEFLGGSILPGVGMAARAMHQFTDLLPELDTSDWHVKPPDVIGNATEPAILSGLFWGTVGAVNELIDRMHQGLHASADVFLTGGGSQTVARFLDAQPEVVPDLILEGIELAE